MKLVGIFLILVTSALAQTPNSEVPGPTFHVDDSHYLLKGPAASIHRVDFRNLIFPKSFEIAGGHSEIVAFKKGHYRSGDSNDRLSEDVGLIYYIAGSSRSQGDSALVFYSWTDGASQGDSARVFRVLNGRLESVQEINWDSHFQQGLPTSQFDTNTNTLVIRSAHNLPGDAPCCVSAEDIVTFRWDGTHFIQSGIRTDLTEYGKKQGKTLPQ